MPASLPLVNRPRQEKVYCGKIDNPAALADDPGMAREPALKEPKLYIGEWIEVLELKQIDVAKASGVKKSYLNLICSRKRDNPSLDVLQSIAKAMKLTISDLQRRPPEKDVVQKVQEMPPGLVERIRGHRKAS